MAGKRKYTRWLTVVILAAGVVLILYGLHIRPADILSGLIRRPALEINDITDGYPATPSGTPARILRYGSFHLQYDTASRQATWTAYILTRDMVEHADYPRTDNFRPDTALSRNISASLADYRRSGYDRGHLVPAGDMKWSPEAMSETFLLTNISPQAPGLNRRIWKNLETQVRHWAVTNDSLYVITGPVFGAGDKHIGKDSLPVPDHFFKVILDISRPTYKGIAFYMSNRPLAGDIFNYAITIDSLESLLHYDFFPDANPKVIDPVEKTLKLREWQ